MTDLVIGNQRTYYGALVPNRQNIIIHGINTTWLWEKQKNAIMIGTPALAKQEHIQDDRRLEWVWVCKNTRDGYKQGLMFLVRRLP